MQALWWILFTYLKLNCYEYKYALINYYNSYVCVCLQAILGLCILTRRISKATFVWLLKGVFIQLSTFWVKTQYCSFLWCSNVQVIFHLPFSGRVIKKNVIQGMDYFKNSSFRKILPRSRQKSFSSILLRCQLKDPYHSAEEHFYKARKEHLTWGLKKRNTDIE